MKAALARPEVKAKLRAVQRVLANDPTVKANKSAGRKKYFLTPAGRAERKRARARKKSEWKDKEKAQAMRAAMKIGNETPEARLNRSAAAKEATTPALCLLRSSAMKRLWGSLGPEEKKQRLAPLLEGGRRPETRKKISELLKKTRGTPEARAAQSQRSKAMAADPKYVEKRNLGQAKRSAVSLGIFNHEEIRGLSGPEFLEKLKRARAGKRSTRTEIWIAALNFREEGKKWPEIARRLTPEKYKLNPRDAGIAIRLGVRKYQKSRALKNPDGENAVRESGDFAQC